MICFKFRYTNKNRLFYLGYTHYHLNLTCSIAVKSVILSQDVLGAVHCEIMDRLNELHTSYDSLKLKRNIICCAQTRASIASILSQLLYGFYLLDNRASAICVDQNYLVEPSELS